ncbi:MAG: hypothetical protein NVS3B21_30500 [Acidimicrobiales bacterium]
MAKSVLHAIVGMLVAEGCLTLDEPAPVPGWEGDDRRGITVCPAIDAVVVRLGRTDAANYPHLRAWVGRVLDAVPG